MLSIFNYRGSVLNGDAVLLALKITAAIIIAYLLGSIPTALIVSRRFSGIDIRSVGDGNMGARNTFHTIGFGYGVLVAVLDFFKGALPVLFALVMGLSTGWLLLTGISAILGHDFPVFAGFKGGQGTATSLGTMLVLFPFPAATGLIAYGIIYLFIKNSNISCGIGGAIIALILGITQQWILFIFAVCVFLFIPVKLFIDLPRRRAIKLSKNSRN